MLSIKIHHCHLHDTNNNLIQEGNTIQCHQNPLDLGRVCFGKFPIYSIIKPDKITRYKVGWYLKPLVTDEISKDKVFQRPLPLNEYYINLLHIEVVSKVGD
jgi:hypothetical protein